MNLKQFIEREQQLNNLIRAAIDSLKELEPQESFVIIDEFPWGKRELARSVE